MYVTRNVSAPIGTPVPFSVNGQLSAPCVATPVNTSGTVAPPTCAVIVPATFNPPGHTAENCPVADVAVWMLMVTWKFEQLDSMGSDVMAAVDIEFAETHVPTSDDDDDDELVGVTAALTLALDGVNGLDVRSTPHAVNATAAATELISSNGRVMFMRPSVSRRRTLGQDRPLQACKHPYTPTRADAAIRGKCERNAETA